MNVDEMSRPPIIDTTHFQWRALHDTSLPDVQGGSAVVAHKAKTVVTVRRSEPNGRDIPALRNQEGGREENNRVI